jgi:hypothetical protein
MHSLIGLAILIWLVMNDPGVVFLLSHVDLTRSGKDSMC